MNNLSPTRVGINTFFTIMLLARGRHKDAHPFFLLWHPLSDVGETPDPEAP